jgi:peptidoglycan/LPS O-acetylase OafA/YrhL
MEMKAQPDNGEIASLTSIRGVAAIWVVLFHLHSTTILFGLLPELSFLSPLTGVGYFAVPFFFVLSGYVLGLRYLTKFHSPTLKSCMRFWWLRLGRVYPIHLLTLLISLAIVGRRGWPTNGEYTLESFISNFFLTHAWHYNFYHTWNYPSWSVSSEWFVYLFFPFLAMLLARLSRRSAAVLVAVACFLSVVVYVFEQDLVFKGLAFVLPTFIGGTGLAIICPPNTNWFGRRLTGVSVILMIFLPFAIQQRSIQIIIYIVLFFLLVAALGANGNRLTGLWRSRPLVWLGEISYSLYMTHVIVMTVMTRFIPLHALNSLPTGVRFLAVLAFLLVILVVAAGAHYVVEQPARNWSRQIIMSKR